MNAAAPHAHIFIVENDSDTLQFLTLYLESLGHLIESARTMTAALAALPASQCDVLISDIGLPDGDGWELMRTARLSKPVYAIAISGYGTRDDVQRSMDAGFRHHLLKPFDGASLRDLIDDAMRERIQ